MADLKQCFVVGPIGAEGSDTRNHANWLLDGIILPVFKEHFSNFEVHRSDRISEPGMIDSQMINRLLDVDLVIADLSELNANAFYEIGIRHMIEKPIVHVYLEGTTIPFDIKPYRAVPFRTKWQAEIVAAQTELAKAVRETQRDGYKVENPVTRARGNLKLRESATPETKLLLERIEGLESRMSSARKVQGINIDETYIVTKIIAASAHSLSHIETEQIIQAVSNISGRRSVTSATVRDSEIHIIFNRLLQSREFAQVETALSKLGMFNVRQIVDMN